MMRWSLVFLFICSACQSKPTQPAPVPEPAEKPLAAPSGKVTVQEPASPPLQLYTLVTSASRRLQEVDTGVKLNSAVQACFTRSEPPKEAPLVSVEGKITSLGTFEGVKIKGADKDLEGCLKTSFKAIALGRGRIGPFKMQISTDQAKIPGSKGLILNPPPVKKFE